MRGTIIEMNFNELLDKPGEHSLTLQGLAGDIEAQMLIPEKARKDFVAILGHPHSLHGGTMNNKVVTTMARTFNELNIISLRFNFRGVGLSEGVFNEGIGESEDMLLLADLWKKSFPEVHFIFAGFSFGSFVAYRTASQHEHELLITIAPPVERFDYQYFTDQPNPWVIIQGDQDDVVSPASVFEFAQSASPKLPVVIFKETGHFFHGKLVDLKSHLINEIKKRIHPL